MHRDESDQLLSCADCGATVDSRERIYGFGTDGVLCFACAERRGGSYDTLHDRWTEVPDLADLIAGAE